MSRERTEKIVSTAECLRRVRERCHEVLFVKGVRKAAKKYPRKEMWSTASLLKENQKPIGPGELQAFKTPQKKAACTKTGSTVNKTNMDGTCFDGDCSTWCMLQSRGTRNEWA